MKRKRVASASEVASSADASLQTKSTASNSNSKFQVAAVNLVVFAMALFVYSNSLHGDYVMDDPAAFRDNPDIQPSTPISNLFRNDFWGLSIRDRKSHKSYRPLTVLSFRLSHALVGSTDDPFWFHLENVCLHALASVLFLWVCRSIRLSVLESGFAALLFAVHAVHVEAVANITGRAELLAAVFFCSAFLVFTHARTAVSYPALLCCLIAWSVLVTCAMLSKEPGITVAGVCVVYDTLISIDWSQARQLSSLIRHIRNQRALVARTAWVGVTVCALLAFRMSVMGGSAPLMPEVNNPLSYSNSTITRVLTNQFLWSWDAWLLLLPRWLSCDYQYSGVPLVESMTDPRNLCTLALWAGVVSVGTLLRYRPKELLLGFSLLVLPFIPASNLFFYVGFVIAERVLYLPSMGACILLALILSALGTRFKLPIQALVGAAVIYLAWHTQRTLARNEDWRTGFSLFQSSIPTLPGNEYLHWGLAQHMRNDDAAKEGVLQRCLEINPQFDKAFLDLAELYRYRGDNEKALEYAKTGVTLPKVMLQLWTKMMNILGDIWFSQGQYPQVLNVCKHVLQRDPDNTQALMNRANSLWSTGQAEKAEADYVRVLELDPGRGGVYNNLGVVFQERGELDKALAMYKQGEAFSESDAAFWNSYGALLCKLHKFTKARQIYQKALDIDPHHKEALHGMSYATRHEQKVAARQ